MEPFKTGQIYKMNEGKVWATFLLSDSLMSGVDEKTMNQIRNSMRLPGVKSVTITPDVHFGYGVAIGTVVHSETHLYPDVVGVDPACSVSLSRIHGVNGLSKLKEKKDVLKSIKERVSVGRGRVNKQAPPLTMRGFKQVIDGFLTPALSWLSYREDKLWKSETREYQQVGDLLELLMTDTMLGQVGSIGSGNHFIELQEDEEGSLYVMAHFGSRGIGATGAKLLEDMVREELKSWGVTTELLYMPAESNIGKLYNVFQRAMLEWSTYNHEIVQEAIEQAIRETFPEARREAIGHIPHNFIERRLGLFVGRKGATPAYGKVPLLIPGSMGTASYVLSPGVKAAKLGESVSHGAGRLFSRRAAKATLNQKEVNQEFKNNGIIGNFEDVPLDEAPGAYKDIDEIIKSLVNSEVAVVEKKLKPVMVIKG